MSPPLNTTPVHTSPAPNHRVLIVDDNADMLESMSMVLHVLGHDVMSASSGLEALAIMESWQPAVALVDVGMPGMSGYEVAQRARANTALVQPVLIALTGWGRDDDRARAIAAGFDRHVIKPVDLPQLRALLDAVPVRRRDEAPSTAAPSHRAPA